MVERKSKKVRDSQVEMTELVLPNDTNQLGNLLGGRLMHLVDIAAAIAAATVPAARILVIVDMILSQ